MLANLARLTSDGLCQAQQAIKERNLEGSMYDSLLLLLGIMINVLEHFPPARASLDEGSLQQLAGLFIEHRESAGDVSSSARLDLLTVLHQLTQTRPIRKRSPRSAWPSAISPWYSAICASKTAADEQ